MSSESMPAVVQPVTEDAELTAEQERDKLRQELDLTVRKLAEAHKMAALGRLAAGIVHEINTPIGSIFSNNDVVLRSLEKVRQLVGDAQSKGEPVPARATGLMETMSSLLAIDKIACERISSVIRSLKTFARVNEGDLRKTDINDLLQSTAKLTSCVFRRQITIEPHYGVLPEIECYPALLSQVFLNLIVNGSQAIQGDGKITITTSHENDSVRVDINDTGAGIKPEDRVKIFAPGFTTKPFGEGTGLGLSISREIVEDTHGGRISFASEMGVGTTFTVVLPVEQPKRQAAQTA